jgi:hypothetical protein
MPAILVKGGHITSCDPILFATNKKVKKTNPMKIRLKASYSKAIGR